MSAPITEAHRELARNAHRAYALASVPSSAQLIADSEARAVRAEQDRKSEWVLSVLAERDQLRAEVEALKQSVESGQRVLREDAERNAVRAEKSEAELATEQARLAQTSEQLSAADKTLDDIDTCSDAYKPDLKNPYVQAVLRLCIKGRDERRNLLESLSETAK